MKKNIFFKKNNSFLVSPVFSRIKSFYFTRFFTFTPKNYFKFAEQERFFLSGDITESIESNYFRKMFKKAYSENLFNVLKNDKIVSSNIKVKFTNGEYRTLNKRCGFKFNYGEMDKWDYTKSVYFETIRDFYHEKYLKRENNLKLYPFFDYTFSDHDAPLNLDQFFTRFCGILLDLDDEYKLASEIEFFIISFTPLGDLPDHNKPIKNVNKIPLKKNIGNIKDFRKSFKNSVLPLTLDENYYGKRFYSRTYIDEENKVKRVVTDLSNNESKKEIFSLITNKLIDCFTDKKINNNTFVRSKSNSSITVRDNKVVRAKMKTKLPYINKLTPKNHQNTFNKNIGSLDLETYLNEISGKNEVYAIGFAYGGDNVMISKPDVKKYYLEKGKTSRDIVLECINSMLVAKYKNTIFYTHNLGGYDIVFILKILADYNKEIGKKYFKMKAILRDNRILKLEISAQISKGVHNKIFLVDSLPLLPSSLASLAKGFSTKYEKPLFPYTFVSVKNLYYIGSTPSFKHFNTDKHSISLTEYKKIFNDNWDLKKETLKYLESDLISLLQIMYEFSDHIFNEHNIQVSESLTITGLAVKIFLTNHYPQKGYLGLLKNPAIYKDIKEAYYGGLSEVYKGYGENLYYYDVNSLYPSEALNDMPGNICDWIETYEEESLDIKEDNLFGFFYADVETNTNDYIGLLPVRIQGLLTYPLGKFSGWWFSTHLEYAIKQGYKVKIRKGYNFNRVSDVFKGYVELLYEEKRKSKGARRLIAKFLLNSLIGRFGMHIEKRITSFIDDRDKYLDIISTHEVYDEKFISEDICLVTHAGEISKNVCEQHSIDYIDILNTKSKINNEFNSIRNVSVGVSAAVTSYSAIFMLKIKKHILALGGKIYYTDTDSIVTNIKLDEYEGVELGKFKLEHEIIRGYFISSKLYCLVVRDGEEEKVLIKSKGVYSSKLKEDDFKKMLNNEIITHAVKGDSKKNYSEGYVSIGVKKGVKLNPNSYKKRIKIYEGETWVDTKPLLLGMDT